MSVDSTKSSYSSSILNDMHYNISFDETKNFKNALNNEYLSYTGKDERYWERRRKNNAAAKRSRERRRQHDEELEQEIQRLKLLNTILQDEISKLQQRILLYESSLINMPTISSNSVSNDTSFSETISSPNSKEENSGSTTENFTFATSEIIEALCKNNIISLTNFQNPIDLSCKLTDSQALSIDVSKDQSKIIYNSNNQELKDQKYWDRRRRNNEAVRKCRQNKRLRVMNSLKVGKEVKDQIHIKIESISSELEKLKSHIKHSETVSMDVPTFDNNTFIPTFTNSKYFNTNGMKWKSKLIEADQADKEMF